MNTPSARTFQAFSSTDASIVNLLHTNLRTALAGVCQASQTYQPSQLLPSAPVSTPLGRVVAAILPMRCDWRRTIERNPKSALVRRHFLPTRRDSSRGTNFSGGIIQALRSLLSRSLVHDANQPTRGFFHRLVFPKVLSCLPFNHAHTKAWSSQNEVQRKSVPGA